MDIEKFSRFEWFMAAWFGAFLALALLSFIPGLLYLDAIAKKLLIGFCVVMLLSLVAEDWFGIDLYGKR